MENDRMRNKMIFFTAIEDAFRDDEDRELDVLGKIEIPEDGNFTNIMTDLFYSVQAFFNLKTNQKLDQLEFLSLLTRLVFQDQLENKD